MQLNTRTTIRPVRKDERGGSKPDYLNDNSDDANYNVTTRKMSQDDPSISIIQ